MPASEFTWNSTASTPIFQVYGTKRKASDIGQIWQQDSQAQVYQVDRHALYFGCCIYGQNLSIRLKVFGTRNCAYTGTCILQQEAISAKRLCSWNPTQIPSFDGHAQAMPVTEINHNHLSAVPHTTSSTQQLPTQQVKKVISKFFWKEAQG